MTEYAVIYEQGDDGAWSARTADLPAFAVGDTRDEALSNLREAVVLYLDHMKERGEFVPQPRSTVGTLSI